MCSLMHMMKKKIKIFSLIKTSLSSLARNKKFRFLIVPTPELQDLEDNDYAVWEANVSRHNGDTI